MCREKYGWDEKISSEHLQRWRRWRDELKKLNKLNVDRCYKPPDFGEVVDVQAHHFADASEIGYGAVSYLRLTNAAGRVHCSFVMGKSHMAPAKKMTIPRLELAAATVAVRLDKMCRRELDMRINESVFWTDSTAVLRYIWNSSKRFHMFVANRLGIIHDGSSPEMWRHVSTAENTADDASWGLSPSEIWKKNRWLAGPDFLWQGKEFWPKLPQDLCDMSYEDPEVRREVGVHFTVSGKVNDAIERFMMRYSLWNDLKKGVAWLLRYKSWLLARVRKKNIEGKHATSSTGPITRDEMREAELCIVQFIQRRHFKKEIEELTNSELVNESKRARKGYVKKSSAICSLDPVLVNGVLRVGGRLKYAPMEDSAKFPIILPKDHHVVDIITRHYHHISGHSGREHVLGLIRERFWIIRGRVTVRRVLKSCTARKNGFTTTAKSMQI